jgi:CO/xanthine dehydrogenase Mo-binding subunit
MSARTTRVEDQRLLTGAGRYTADLSRPGQLYGVFLRSPHAHAGVASIDAGEALAHPGVVAILTGAVPAVVNAIIDALAPLGITHIDMPATPQRVWQAMAAAKSARAGAGTPDADRRPA